MRHLFAGLAVLALAATEASQASTEPTKPASNISNGDPDAALRARIDAGADPGHDAAEAAKADDFRMIMTRDGHRAIIDHPVGLICRFEGRWPEYLGSVYADQPSYPPGPSPNAHYIAYATAYNLTLLGAPKSPFANACRLIPSTSPASPEIVHPDWIIRPSLTQIARAYPKQARRLKTGGSPSPSAGFSQMVR